MAEEIDPYDWTLDQVVDAFCLNRTLWQVEQPNAVLPDPATFERTLRENDIYGAALLNDVTSQALKDDFGIKSLGQRSSIAWAINKLQARSLKFAAERPPITPSFSGYQSTPGHLNPFGTPHPYTPRASFHTEQPTILSPYTSTRAAEDNQEVHTEGGLSPFATRPSLLPRTAPTGAQSPPVPVTLHSVPETSSETVQPHDDAAPGKRRADEVLVQDQTGRKRRRLDLSAVNKDAAAEKSSNLNDDTVFPSSETGALFVTANTTVPTTNPTSDLRTRRGTATTHLSSDLRLRLCGLKPGNVSFLGKNKLSLEDVFFGATKYGKQLNADIDLTPLVTEGRSYGQALEYDGSLSKSIYGRQGFVNRKFMSFLRRDPALEVKTKDESVAFYPYSAISSAHPNSRALIHIKENDGIVTAKRTKFDQVMHGDTGLNFDATSSNHDWDFLSHWHRNGNNEELPAYGESDYEDEAEFEATAREIEEDEEEDAEEKKKRQLSQERVAEIIEQHITEQVKTWREKRLPVFQDKALSTWKKGGNTRGRRILANLAQQEVAKLNAKISKLSQDIAGDAWTVEKELRVQCESLDESVKAREQETFKMSVWQSVKPPPPPSGKLRTRKKRDTHVSADAAEHMLDSDEEVVDDRPDLGEFVELDDLMELDLTSGEDLQDMHADDDEVLPRPDDMVPGSDDEVVPETDPLELPDTVNQNHENDDDTMDEDETQDEDTPRAHSDTVSVPSREHEVDKAQDGPVKQEPVSARKVRVELPAHDFVDLTLDSDIESPVRPVSAGPSRQTQAGPSRTEFSNTPIDDPDEEIAHWDWSRLADKNDRIRIIIKLLREMPPVEYLRLHEHLLEHEPPNIPRIYEIAVNVERVLRRRLGMQTNFEIAEYAFERADEVLHLYICWLECLPLYFREGYDTGEETFELVYLDTPVLESALKELNNANNEDLSDFLRCICEILRKHPLPLDTADEEGDDGTEVQELDAEQFSQMTPRKQRKNQVAESQAAITKRQKSKKKASTWNDRTEAYLQQSVHQSSQLSSATGDIVVNTGKDEDEPEIHIDPRIGQSLKPHQVDGIRFMWREIVGTADDSEETQGCLLAHTMGLGKTLQVIAFIDTLAEAAKNSTWTIRKQIPKRLRDMRVLILSPAGLISNWSDEFKKWNKRGSIIGAPYIITAQTNKKDSKLELLNEWYSAEKGSVLLMGYELFRSWVMNQKSAKGGAPFSDEEHKVVCKQLLQGPTLVIADEAHKLKNHDSSVTKAAKEIKTKSRIALTGSPLSNNLLEYYAMVNWIAPNYLGDLVEFKANYVEPIENGLWIGSSKTELRKARILMAALITMLEPKIDRREINVLQDDLKQRVQFVLKVPLTPLQSDVYEAFVKTSRFGIGESVSNARLWGFMAYLQQLCGHPALFKVAIDEAVKKDMNSTLKKPKESGKKRGKSPVKRVQQEEAGKSPRSEADGDETDHSEETRDDAEDDGGAPADSTTLQIASKVYTDLANTFAPVMAAFYEAQFSHKVNLLLQIVKKSIRIKDKLLIFSHRIHTLNYLGEVLKKEGVRCERLDGGTAMNKRQEMTRSFNEDDKYDVFLISTRAGGIGFNLYGANRVILFDFSFNPTWEEQAIGRAFRLGQQKSVYVYRFISAGTFEEKLFDQTVFKLQLSYNVVEKKSTKNKAVRVRDYIKLPEKSTVQNLADSLGNDDVLKKIVGEMEEGNELIHGITEDTVFKEEMAEKLDAEAKKEMEQLVQQNQLRIADPEAYLKALAARPNPPSSTAARVPPGTSEHMSGPALAERMSTPSIAPVAPMLPARLVASATNIPPTAQFKLPPANPGEQPHGLPDFSVPRFNLQDVYDSALQQLGPRSRSGDGGSSSSSSRPAQRQGQQAE